MLINFTVDHFRSFGVEQTLNMVATPLKDHPGHCVEIPGTDKSVLQIGVIYGANAAGKTNLVKAIWFAHRMILGQTNLKAIVQNRFRFMKKIKPVSFEFRFLAGGQVFVYGFTITQEAILEEWLDAMSESGRETNVFNRRSQEIDIGRLQSFGAHRPTLNKALKALKQLGVRDDQLLLNKIVEMPDHHRGDLLNRVVRWFQQCLVVVRPESVFTPLVKMLDADADFRRFCGAFLKNVGTGINDLTIETERIDADTIPKSVLDQLQSLNDNNITFKFDRPGYALELDPTDPNMVVRKNLNAKHQLNSEDYALSYHEESDGTQRCLNILPALYNLTQECEVFVVDEIDRSLHPLLSYNLLKLFLEVCPGKCQQMIVTTHETHLLDLDLLRRDEIWFVEKDHRQQSRLSSLADFKARKDLRIEKGYLQGRFGGIPFIGDTKKLMDLIQCSDNGTRNEKKTPP